MTELISQKDLRTKRGSNILNYVKNFSATEKVLFGIFVVAVAVTALTMAGWISNRFSTEVAAYGGTLREGVVGLPRNINPILAVTDVDRDLTALVYSGLMRYSDGKIVPDIAKSYEISVDGLVYTFKLKPGVKFHDGADLTADDIAFTIQKIQDPALKSPRRADWSNVSVKVISPAEIQFTLKQPYSPFLSNTTLGIVPKHIWGSVNDEQFIFSQYNTEPVGSGMYRVDSISRDSGGIPTRYTLSSWRRYYGKDPYIPTIVFNFFSDESAALNALDQGKIDTLASVSPEAASRLATDTAQAYVISSSPLPRIFGVFFNQNQAKVLSDKTVRQALETSIDRQYIVDTVLKGYGMPVNGPVPPTRSSSTPQIFDRSATTGIAMAQKLLEKDGWKKNADGVYEYKNKTSTLLLAFDIYTADSPDLRRAAEIVRKTWNDMGAQVGMKLYESNDFYQNIIRTRKYDALLFGEVIGKDRDLYAFWHSSQRNAPGLNISMYANSKTDKLLEDMRTTTSESARASKYDQFDQIIRSEIPAVFLYVPDFIYAIPKKLAGMDLSLAAPSDRWNTVARWYTETEKVWNLFK